MDDQAPRDLVPIAGPSSLIALPDFSAHWIEDLANETYHADKTAMNSSAMKHFKKSPATFFAHFFGQVKRRQTKPMKLGTLFHLAFLEPDRFERTFIRVPEFLGLTKDGRESSRSSEAIRRREEWFKALPKDATPVTEEEYAMVMGMLNSVQRHNDASGIFKQGKAELSGYYSDPETGIRCRIRPDFLFAGKNVALVDVKTVEDCSAEAFSRWLFNYQAHVQMAMYCEGVQNITGRKVDFPLYLAIEREPPYEVAVYIADEMFLHKGSLEYHLALNTLKVCIETNEWSGYQKKAQPIGLPTWAFRE